MKKLVLFLCMWSWAATSAAAAGTWSFESFLGDAYNFRSPLKIEFGGASLSQKADYETKGLESPYYYALRGGRWDGDHGWELSLIHHKLYLQNPPPGVESLSISHGFNIATVNRAFRRDNWTYRFGAGPVIAHAEGTFNGMHYDGNYMLAGVAVLAGGGRRFYLGKSLFLSLEAAFTAGYVSPHIAGPPEVAIRASNFAIHGLAGIGIELP